jgi:hypothetical protein
MWGLAEEKRIEEEENVWGMQDRKEGKGTI